MVKLGEFELLVILSILRNPREPYANRVREDLEHHADRKVTRGALYRTIDRLQEKGFVRWDLVPTQIPERGGHPMRRLEVTPAGTAAAQHQKLVLERFFDGLPLGGQS